LDRGIRGHRRINRTRGEESGVTMAEQGTSARGEDDEPAGEDEPPPDERDD
jgi:hypothetical protein